MTSRALMRGHRNPRTGDSEENRVAVASYQVPGQLSAARNRLSNWQLATGNRRVY